MKKSLSTIALLVCTQLLPAQIVNIERHRIKGTNDSTRWYGTLKAAANWTRIQKSILVLQGEGRVQYRKDKHIALFIINSNLIRTEKEDFTNAHFAHLRYTGKLTETLAWESFSQIQSNQLTLLKLRQLAGIGLRQRLFKKTLRQQRAYLGTAPMYEYNQFLENYPTADWWRWNNYLSLTFSLKNAISLVSTSYWQPIFSDFNNYRFASEWSLQLPVFKNLNFVSDITYWHDRSLPAGRFIDFYIWKNGLVWQFK